MGREARFTGSLTLSGTRHPYLHRLLALPLDKPTVPFSPAKVFYRSSPAVDSSLLL